MKISARAAVIAALVGLLAGCSSPAPVPAASTSAAPRPTPASATDPVPLPSVPLAAFGGDCSVVATDAEVTAATGGTATTSPVELTSVGDMAILTLGGIRCVWTADEGEGAWVTVIPTAAVGAAVLDDASDGQPYCYRSDGGAGEQDACSFSTTVNDWWYAGVVYAAHDSDVDPVDAIDALVTDFGSRAPAHPAAVPAKADGSWTTVPTCEALGSAVDTTPLVGVDLEAEPGSDPGEAGPGYYGALAAAGERSCFWQGDDRTVEVALLPGGWWAVEQQKARPGSVVVDVPGVRASAVVPAADGDRFDTVYLSDGANLVRVYGDFSDAQRGALGSAVMAAVSS